MLPYDHERVLLGFSPLDWPLSQTLRFSVYYFVIISDSFLHSFELNFQKAQRIN